MTGLENEDNPASPMKKGEEHGESPTSGKRGDNMQSPSVK